MKIFSVDFGNLGDYTAYSVIEAEEKWESPEVNGIKRMKQRAHYVFKVRYLERVSAEMSYPEIIKDIKTKLKHPKVAGSQLVVDGTGVGLPVLQEMQEQGLNPIGICITGGQNVGEWKARSGSRLGYTVPKRDIVTTLQNAFASRRLIIPRKLAHADAFVEELVNFKLKISRNGSDTYEAWRESIHDDLVLSVGIGVWYVAYVYGLTRAVARDNVEVLTEMLKAENYDPLNI